MFWKSHEGFGTLEKFGYDLNGLVLFEKVQLRFGRISKLWERLILLGYFSNGLVLSEKVQICFCRITNIVESL